MKQPESGALDRVAAWLGIGLDAVQRERLHRYAEWLSGEGVAIGGLGPSEVDRLWDRHVIDSLTFGIGLRAGASLLDAGTGVGLPGIPLAIAFPATEVTLLDRSGRRIDALHRVARMIDLDVAVVAGDVARHRGTYDRVVMRAVLRPERAGQLLRLVAPGGEIVVGLGRGPNPPDPGIPGRIVEIESRVLENGGWLLMIPGT